MTYARLPSELHWISACWSTVSFLLCYNANVLVSACSDSDLLLERMRSFPTCALGAILSFISLFEPIHASKDLLVLDLHRPLAATGANANERRQTTTSDGAIALGLTDPVCSGIYCS